jgi:hypothetical protein
MGGTAALLVMVTSLVLAGPNPDWTPARWADLDTLQLHTVGPTEGPYDFPVWLVVIDDEVYVRLGSRAARRVETSTTQPYVGVTVAGRHFPRVRTEPVPEMAGAVSAAMAKKYWSDLIIRFLPHPLTLRLRPD